MTFEPHRAAGPPPPPPPPPPPSPPGVPTPQAWGGPYYGRPIYPAPPRQTGRTEGRTIASLLLAIFGLLIAMTGVLGALIALVTANGDLLNALLLGLPGMVGGIVAYFLGKSAIARIAESPTILGGRPTAVAGWVIGAISTATGAVVTLVWIVLFLVANFGPPPP